MPDVRPAIGLPPTETVEFFRAKGYATQTHWDELWQEEHGRAFTVTKMLRGDLLEKVRASLDDVLANGGTFEQWKAKILPELQAAGWWGKVEDATLTGSDKPVWIGDRRLRTIYGTNLRMARAAGQWKRIQALKARAPYLMYVAIKDGRTRPLHRIWGGVDNKRPIILPADHPIWNWLFPPNGWGCRCTVIQLSERDLRNMGLRVTTDAELGAMGWQRTEDGGIAPPENRWRRSDGTVERVPQGVDPGFAYNPGVAHMRALEMPLDDRPLQAPHILPDPARDAPPMPAPRNRDASVLLPKDTDYEQVVDTFHASFRHPKNSAGVILTRDAIGEPLVIGDSFFWRGGVPGGPDTRKLRDSDRRQGIRLLAEALDDPDEIWWQWETVKVDQAGTLGARLTRRYISRFDIDGRVYSAIVVVRMGRDGWQGVTAIINSKNDNYAINARGGVLAYRRP